MYYNTVEHLDNDEKCLRISYHINQILLIQHHCEMSKTYKNRNIIPLSVTPSPFHALKSISSKDGISASGNFTSSECLTFKSQPPR